MGTIEPSPFLHGILGTLLLLSAWLDLRHRELPLGLPLAILAAGAALLLLSFPSANDHELYLAAALLCVVAFLGLLAGWIGLADAMVGAALTLTAASLQEEQQAYGAVFCAAGTCIGVALWYVVRAVRSIRISGVPRNFWDLLALSKGRLDAEPHLERFQRKKRKSSLLLHLEAFRTPDGSHLGHDPCPLVSCLALGYLGMLVSLLV